MRRKFVKEIIDIILPAEQNVNVFNVSQFNGGGRNKEKEKEKKLVVVFHELKEIVGLIGTCCVMCRFRETI